LSATVNLNSHHFAGVLAALRAGEFDRAACGAMIVVPPDAQPGHTFRLHLDALVPFKLVDPANSERSEVSRQRA
jgi:hypothetical protein